MTTTRCSIRSALLLPLVAGALSAQNVTPSATAVASAATGRTDGVTFAKDVAPILQQKCQVCHQPNSIAPMSLLTYDDAKSYANEIREYLTTRVMPPWHID